MLTLPLSFYKMTIGAIKKFLLLIILGLLLSGCVSTNRNYPPSFQATLDSMVQATLDAAPRTNTPQPTETPTSTPEPTQTAEPVQPKRDQDVTPQVEERAASMEREEGGEATALPRSFSTFTPTPTPVSVLACLNQMNALNVRELPEFDSLRVDIMARLDCAELVERTEDNLWAKVKESGKLKEGWVPVEFLDISDLKSKLEQLPIFKFKR